MQNNNGFFGDIEKKTGVKMNDVFELVGSLQSANLKDEKTVRNVISKVSQMAGKKVSQEQEDQIVNAIVNNNVPMDISQISKMLGKNSK